MNNLKQIIFLILISLLLYSCSYFSSSSVNEFIYHDIILPTHFVIVQQDTISFSNGDFFNYCLLTDSIGRKFFVLEDGCSYMPTKSFVKVGLNDTIQINITLTNPYRFDNDSRGEFFRGPNLESVIIVEGKNAFQVYQSDRLCNHSLLVTK